ncbi:MAG TPA: ribonuclease HII [Candidatus Nanopelagicaceae bacterium]|nr:ribonuclease HII [Candidatus Nanopelagicaceae bacterium]
MTNGAKLSGNMRGHEQALEDSGIWPVAGADEAGRGACAGPLVIASVILPPPSRPLPEELMSIADSKALTERRRELLFDHIMSDAHAVSVICVDVEEIDEKGVHAANISGMRRALLALDPAPQYVLTDGFAIAGVGVPGLAVWKGDQVSAAIAAASIIAKVTRDRIMVDLDEEFPEYGFAKHKGYITRVHEAALIEHGPSSEHRKSFANIAALLGP